MNAIVDNGKTYKVTGERGDFWITEDGFGKIKMFVKKNVEVVEISEMPKVKKFKPSYGSGSGRVNTYISLVQSELDDTCSGRTIFAKISDSGIEMTDIVKSILNQANVKSGRISDKQVYVVAKFISDNNISI